MSDIQAYDVQTFAKAYGISRAQIYVEIKSGRLRIFKVGKRTLISRESATAWREALEREMVPKSSHPHPEPGPKSPDSDSMALGTGADPNGPAQAKATQSGAHQCTHRAHTGPHTMPHTTGTMSCKQP